MNRWLLPTLLLYAFALVAAAEPAPTPRNFGYFIGDLLTQRIPLQVGGKSLELIERPPERRVDRWLQRLKSTPLRDESGRDWLLLTYQIVNAPRETVTITLPGLSLPVVDGEPLEVAPIPISISPLTPTALDDDLPSIRPDRLPAPPATAAGAQRLRFIGLALGVTLAAWLGWWLWRRHVDAGRLPFADAFHHLSSLQAPRLDDNPAAWLALHRAFNATAGRSITGSDVGILLQRAPWLASQRVRIEAFYALSTARFFAQRPQPSPFALVEFSRDLYRSEKRYGVPRPNPETLA